jgi:uncharacterized protein (TIGR00661 family)
MKSKPLHILVSPLDWGLGHASRCIPVIHELIKAGHIVTVAGQGRSLLLLQKEFPFVESIATEGFSPSYSKSGNLIFHLLLLLPRFLFSILRDHRMLKKLIRKHRFDIVISDNRYGLWNRKIKSIIITHQVMLKMPGWLEFAEYLAYSVSQLLISRFDECWIPDYPEKPGLSGDLSHKYAKPRNAKFIGPLSRFQSIENDTIPIQDKKRITILISGPEPQRSIFEDLILHQITGLEFNFTLISGKPESEKINPGNKELTIFPHLAAKELCSLIGSSALVICRSGYSSIMDLHALGAKALFVPTPGQTEQIYLAKILNANGTALWIQQKDLDLKVDIEKALSFQGFSNQELKTGVLEAISDLENI